MLALTVTTPPPDQRLRTPEHSTAIPAGYRARMAIGQASDPDRDDALAAAGGDRDAFERLYRSQLPRVYSLVARMLGDQREAEEVVQDVFVRAWRKLPTFRGDAALSTWLHRLAVNVVLSRRKSEGIRKDRTSDDMVNWAKHAMAFGERMPEIPDFAVDMHTGRGEAMGRDYLYFMTEASKVSPEIEGRDETYRDWILAALKAGKLT